MSANMHLRTIQNIFMTCWLAGKRSLPFGLLVLKIIMQGGEILFFYFHVHIQSITVLPKHLPLQIISCFFNMRPPKVNEKFKNTAKTTLSASSSAIATLPASGTTVNRKNVMETFHHPKESKRTTLQNASYKNGKYN